MATNNDILYNAAIAGFIGGAMAGRNPTSQTSGDYTDLVDAAEAFATQVDSKIANDATISEADGDAKAPATNTIQQAQLGKVQCMAQLCMALTSGRSYNSEVAADYDDLADVIAAEYAAAIAALLTGS